VLGVLPALQINEREQLEGIKGIRSVVRGISDSASLGQPDVVQIECVSEFR